MSIGYDPFKWADNFESEEEYIKELINENDTQYNQYQQSGRMVTEKE